MSTALPTKFFTPSYNPRKPLSKEKLAKLDKLLHDFGDLSTIVINKDGTIISGHQRTDVINLNSINIKITEQFDTPTEGRTIAWGIAEYAGCKYTIRYVDLTPAEMEVALIAANKFEGEYDIDILQSFFTENNLFEAGISESFIADVFKDTSIPNNVVLENVKDDTVPQSILKSAEFNVWNPKKNRFDTRAFPLTATEEDQFNDTIKQYKNVYGDTTKGFVKFLLEDFVRRNPAYEEVINTYQPQTSQ